MINKVILVGRISSVIELKEAANDTTIATFSIAVDRSKKKSQTSNSTDFLRCKAFNKTANNVFKYCKKGSLICVTGQIHNNQFVVQGKRSYYVEIVIENIKFLPNIGAQKVDGASPDQLWEKLSDDEKLMLMKFTKYQMSYEQKENEERSNEIIESTPQEEKEVVASTNGNIAYKSWHNKLNEDEAELQATSEDMKEDTKESNEVPNDLKVGAVDIIDHVTKDNTRTVENNRQEETNQESNMTESEDTIMTEATPF